MHTLEVRHLPDSDPPQFQLVRMRDGKRADPVFIPSPVGYPVVGRPKGHLMSELAWYLETFLDYPFPPETKVAERVLEALEAWGREAFSALFSTRWGIEWYAAAVAQGREHLRLQVASDDARILAWPWEGLRDPLTDRMALDCQIERKLNEVDDPIALSEALPRNCVNILLVTARPFKADVAFRSISRPLVDLVNEHSLPARITVLRPPTLQSLRNHLLAHPDTYHVLHFDGHGGYGVGPDLAADPHRLRAPQGHLVFESVDGTPDPVPARKLSQLLREHRIPAVVLNACQSAMVDEYAEDAFASVAASLVRAGVRSVVAMAYSLYVSGARQFLPAFYLRLFESGSVTEATRAGRQQMYQEDGRVCARGKFPLRDWLVPVVYQQEGVDFSFAANADGAKEVAVPELPAAATDKEDPYGFVGRDGAILELERAMRRAPAGILVHGLGGVGKTTLARGFARWLAQTGGLGHGCFWFGFQEIRSAEFVVNRMGETLFGPGFSTASLDSRLEILAKTLHQQPFLVVWDNFESARGMAGTAQTAQLSAADQGVLKRLLQRLRGGRTKVVITSRSEEEWLGVENRFRVGLGGLAREERWEYCRVILEDLGLAVNRDDPELAKLIEVLGGHPLLMRAVLPKLDERSAAEIGAALAENLDELGLSGDEVHEKVLATLRFVQGSLPEDLQPLLMPLSLHERFVDADHLEQMAKSVHERWTRDRIDCFLAALAVAGLVRDRGQATVFELHPALTGFLRGEDALGTDEGEREAWVRAFVGLMGSLANAVMHLPPHQQSFTFLCHKSNLHSALAEAVRLGMNNRSAAITQSLAIHAQFARDLAGAEALFRQLADHCRQEGMQDHEAGAIHHLAMIAEERHSFDAAEQRYRKAAEIREKLGNHGGAANAYHQLGIVAEKQRHLSAAEQWYLKAAEIRERLGIEDLAATDYFQLGMVAYKRREFDSAEQWTRKAVAIDLKLGNVDGAATTYLQLGRIARERREFVAAEDWYQKALALFKNVGDEHSLAIAYGELGNLAYWRRDFVAAEQWARNAVTIFEKLGIEEHAASAYHLLGLIAKERGDLDATKGWYQKALANFEKVGNVHSAAHTYGELGHLAAESESYEDAGRWLIKSIAAFLRKQDHHHAEHNARRFRVAFDSASPEGQAVLGDLWAQAGLGRFPEAEAGEEHEPKSREVP